MKIRNILLIKAKLCIVTFAAYHVIFVAVVLLPDLGYKSNVTAETDPTRGLQPGILSALNSDADFSGVGNVNRVTEGARDLEASQSQSKQESNDKHEDDEENSEDQDMFSEYETSQSQNKLEPSQILSSSL